MIKQIENDMVLARMIAEKSEQIINQVREIERITRENAALTEKVNALMIASVKKEGENRE